MNGTTETDDKNEFKFAITALTAFGTILYTTYNYFQNNAVNNNSLYYYIYLSISVIITSSLLFGIYILIKGVSIGMGTSKEWRKYASITYLFTFAATLGMFILGILIYIGIYVLNIKRDVGIVVIIISFAIILFLYYIFKNGIYFTLEKIKQNLKLTIIKQYLKQNWKIIVVSVFLYLGIHTAFSESGSFYLTEGSVTIRMNDIYHKNNDVQIPASIKVTGLNYGLNTILLNNSEQNLTHLTQIYSIEIKRKHNANEIKFVKNSTLINSTLIGYSIDDENYNIFINTTDLTPGYYELVVYTFNNSKDYRKGFYLLQ